MRKKIFWFFVILLLGMWGHHVWLRVGKPSMTDEIRAKNGKKSVALSSGTVAYEYFEGEGTPVVLVNGFSMPSVVWDNTFNTLKRSGVTVLRFDLFGRGFSDRPNTKYNADLFVGQVKELTEKILPGQKFVICGLSMGGAISVYFTDKYPDKIEKLILIAPAGFPMETPAVASLVKAPLLGDYLGRLFARRSLEKGMADNFTTPVPPQMAAQSLQQTEYAGYADAIVSTLRNMNMTKMEDVYARVGAKKIPTLLIWGKKDKVVPFANAALVKKAIPHTEFLELENAGHIPTVDEDKKTHAAMREFLSGE
jgi:pimeloyl-ACP methyl ester carboxylesterase